jgi:hypothetical protein
MRAMPATDASRSISAVPCTIDRIGIGNGKRRPKPPRCIIRIADKIVACDDLFRWKRAGFNDGRIVVAERFWRAWTAKRRMRIIDAAVDDANANAIAGQLTGSAPELGCANERDGACSCTFLGSDDMDANNTWQTAKSG